MRVLVTGASGFLGRALSGHLAKTGDVVPLRGDIRDPATFEHLPPADLVYHLAAQSNVPASFSDPAGTWSANVEGTRNVLAWAKRAEVGRVVVLSSAHVYGRPVRSPLDETHPLAPVSPYGASKLGTEAAARMASAQGVETVIVRPFNIYGPGQATGFLVPDILEQLRRGGPLVLGDPKPVRDYTYLDDAIDFLAKAGTAPAAAGQALNLASGQGHAVAEVVETALAAAASTTRPTYDQGRFRANEVAEMVGDVRLAQRLLGWTAKVDLANGLRHTWTLASAPAA